MDSFLCVCTGNNIGDEGTKILGESLKYNVALTTLNLAGMKHLTFDICNVAEADGLLHS